MTHSLYQLSFSVPAKLAPLFEAVGEEALAVSRIGEEEDPAIRIEMLFDHLLSEAEIAGRLSVIAAAQNIDAPLFTLALLEQKNWLEEVQRQFPPLSIGRFRIVRMAEEVERNPYCLKLEAGLAFGSGEHATTSGCLLALQQLAKRRKFSRILDIGTGSGILALGAARMFRRKALAVDIDPISVKVAKENAAKNQLATLIRAFASNGTQHPHIKAQGPYDLILANILLRPLIRIAPQVRMLLSPGGYLILSGILKRQERALFHAYRGLRLRAIIRQGDWSAVILQRP